MVFDKRGVSPHEAKHSRDAELDFKVTVRRNKLAGLWAAELLGLIGQAAHDYAKQVVHSDFEEPGEEDVVRKLDSDLKGKVTLHEIREKMSHFLHVARDQIMGEHKKD
ncbi:MAG: DUF1476 domain-containing protein [Alphaproteobacteria bacterium]|nr:DUF1476 domain-containing protein [Alphaproteobacteria bacterium]MBF0392821.1 DUF1476 domain-containing protein [Alphaproteobacteria bacterium]